MQKKVLLLCSKRQASGTAVVPLTSAIAKNKQKASSIYTEKRKGKSVSYASTADSLGKLERSRINSSTPSVSSSITSGSNVDLLDHVDSKYTSAELQVNLLKHLESRNEAGKKCYRDVAASALAASFLDAIRTVGTLLNTGQFDEAVQVASLWNGRASQISPRAKTRATRLLSQSIDTLTTLKDVETLRLLRSVLGTSHHELMDMHSVLVQRSSPMEMSHQYRLFFLLGEKRVRKLYVNVIDAICRLDDSAGVSLVEKIGLLAKAVPSSSVTRSSQQKTALVKPIPYQLYNTFVSSIQSRVDYDEDLVSQISPTLLSSLIHPYGYDILDTMALSKSELALIRKELGKGYDGKDTLLHSSSSSWETITSRFLSASPPLIASQQNSCLLDIIMHPETEIKRNIHELNQIELATRTSIVSLLQSPNAHDRYAASRLLLQNPSIMRALNISPIGVAAAFALTFKSMKRVKLSLARLCVPVVTQLCKIGSYSKAAQIAWNHLSVECPENVVLFKKHPLTVDYAVTAMCKTMHHEIRQGDAKKWMAYRSMALLRTAAKANTVAPMHCIPVGIAALESGVPFAAVNECLEEIFQGTNAAEKWTLDLIRICISSNMSVSSISTKRATFPERIDGVLKRVYNFFPQRRAGSNRIIVNIPNRSKQLALWAALSNPTINPTLASLTIAAYMNEEVRAHFLECDFILPRGVSAGTNVQTSASSLFSPTTCLDEIYTWESAASVASNCTSPQSYVVMLNALANKVMSPAMETCFLASPSKSIELGSTIKIHQLLQSECDDDELYIGYKSEASGPTPIGKQ